MSADMLTAALELAARGWPVFPLHTPTGAGCSCGYADCANIGKHPRTANGLHDATTDTDTIAAWWGRWPAANIGARTGVAFDVLDLDDDDPLAATEGWPAVEMPGGPVARTARGWHFLVLPTGHGNRAKIAGARADWRGAGGYVVAPPSLHATGKRYGWFTPSTLALQPAPAELLALLAPPPAPARPRHHTAAGASNGAPGAGLAGIYGKVAIAAEGNRNATLWWAARQIGLKVYRGELTNGEGKGALDPLHEVAARTGLTDREIEATIASGWSTGIAGVEGRTAGGAA